MFFFHKKTKTLKRRMANSKGIGLGIGLLGGFWLLPYYMGTDLTLSLQWGIVLWYLTFGAVIGLGGLLTVCPWMGKKCPFYGAGSWRPLWRGGFTGAWLNFVLAIIMYDTFAEIMSYFSSLPFANMDIVLLAVIEGFIIGAFIDLLSTKFGGEGKEIL
ncbi:hypothetical protein K9M41_01280 [Candidatus Gracilibacteria bacterium]|nr:hypothetical protein [Candidatus Gracilibacteria bacterium]